MIVLLLAAGLAAAACGDGLDGTFVQLSERELDRDAEAWAEDLAHFRSLGLGTIVVQFTGDAHGPFDGRGGARPVDALLSAATEAGIAVWLGTWHDPAWPHADHLRRLPPPLADSAAAAELASTCRRHPSCAGYYLSAELDETTFAAWKPAVRQYLARATDRLDTLDPGRPVAIAPYASRRASPEETAGFWRRVAPGTGVDRLWLQDGVGTGQATPEEAAERLRAVKEALSDSAVRVGAVVELFAQRHGPPVDDRPFAAVPADAERVARALEAGAAIAEEQLAFAVLDHLHPDRGREAAQLHRGYLARCPTPEGPGAAPRR